jgi:curved DNA-binding protein CbpA
MAERDAYRVLHVDPAADPDVIAAAYRVLARKLHPDTGGDDATRMAELTRAYAILRDPERRLAYDRERRGGVAAAVAANPVPARAEGAAAGSQLDFGRYAGWTLAEVARRDPDYLRWLSRHASGARFRIEIGRLLGEPPVAGRTPGRSEGR